MSDFTFEGQGAIKLVEKFVSKEGKRWLKIVVETDGKWPQAIPVVVFGQMATHEFSVGEMVLVRGTIGGKQWNGKYFADVKANFIQSIGAATNPPEAKPDDDFPF